jgi:hypothetical protein
VQCLQDGSFRTQSAVLEFLANAIGHSLSASPESDDVCRGHEHMQPRIPRALSLLVADEGMPVLSAALALCREQPSAGGGKSSAAFEGAQKDGGRGEWARALATPGNGSSRGAGGGDARTARDDANAYVQQKCCDDPADCEEPAVRERALRLLSCLARRAYVSCPAVASVAAAPAGSGASGGGSEKTKDGDEGDSSSDDVMRREVAQKLWQLCTSEALIKDVLAAFNVSSAMVTAAAG